MRAAERDTKSALYDIVHKARLPWQHVVGRGQVLRIVDLEGCQAVDTLIYNAVEPLERYDLQQTIQAQRNIFITTGTKILSTEGRVLMTVEADSVGNHDTLGGACSSECNTVRFGLDKRHMHSCRDNFIHVFAEAGLSKSDIVGNLNFFMNVPVEADGHLAIVDGVSKPGSFVDLRAEMDVRVLISNCPQINNPCNAFNPTPIRLTIWDS
jgi:urea carboxylase-associated protein 1